MPILQQQQQRTIRICHFQEANHDPVTNLVSACRTHGLRCQKTLSSSKETFCAPGWSRATFTFTVVCPKDGCRRFFSAFYVVPFFLLSHHMLSDWSHNAKSIGLLVPARRTHAIGDFWLVEWWWTHWCMTFTPDLASDCVRHESWEWQLWWWTTGGGKDDPE